MRHAALADQDIIRRHREIWAARPELRAVYQQWFAQLLRRVDGLRPIVEPDEDGEVSSTPYGSAFTGADEAPIPRFDLPFGMPSWHGTDAGQSERNGNKQIIWKAP